MRWVLCNALGIWPVPTNHDQKVSIHNPALLPGYTCRNSHNYDQVIIMYMYMEARSIVYMRAEVMTSCNKAMIVFDIDLLSIAT